MSTPAPTTAPAPAPGTIKPQRRYTEDDIHNALLELELNNGSIAATSRATGIPEQTLRQWRDRDVYVPPPEVVAQERLVRAARWDALQGAAVEQALKRLPDASARDAAIIAGIAVDKAAILRGDTAPAVDPETLARLELFRQHYAAAQQLHVHTHTHVHLPTGPGTPEPAPVPVLVQAVQPERPAGSEESDGGSVGQPGT